MLHRETKRETRMPPLARSHPPRAVGSSDTEAAPEQSGSIPPDDPPQSHGCGSRGNRGRTETRSRPSVSQVSAPSVKLAPDIRTTSSSTGLAVGVQSPGSRAIPAFRGHCVVRSWNWRAERRQIRVSG
jgi:hypothetical protein